MDMNFFRHEFFHHKEHEEHEDFLDTDLRKIYTAFLGPQRFVVCGQLAVASGGRNEEHMVVRRRQHRPQAYSKKRAEPQAATANADFEGVGIYD